MKTLARFIDWVLGIPNTGELAKMPYPEYLQTQHWQKLRLKALQYAGNRCQVCYSGHNLQVHHRTYIRKGCEKLSDLTVMCDQCHGLFHKHGRLYNQFRLARRYY